MPTSSCISHMSLSCCSESAGGRHSRASAWSAALLRRLCSSTELGRAPSGATGYGGSKVARGGKNLRRGPGWWGESGGESEVKFYTKTSAVNYVRSGILFGIHNCPQLQKNNAREKSQHLYYKSIIRSNSLKIFIIVFRFTVLLCSVSGRGLRYIQGSSGVTLRP